MKFQKKPIAIEAMQYGDSVEQRNKLLDWANSFPSVWSKEYPLNVTHYTAHNRIVVHTLQGNVEVSPGDWLIRDGKGEFDSCKPDIFEATYEPGRES